MKILKIIIKNIKKYYSDMFFRAKFLYTKYYEKLDIKENEVLLQSYNGNSISGNVYYILLELCNKEEYITLKKYVVAGNSQYEEIKNFIMIKKLRNVEIIKIHSKKYCKKLAEVKYLINNVTFPSYFIKKDGQIYLNTWHGTPLKAMGRNIKNAQNEIGNTQRNFLMADYLLEPNEFTFEHFKDDYMLDNIYKGKYILYGYPRNSIFFDNNSRNIIRKKLNLNGKKVIVYMPTWRGSLQRKNNYKQFTDVMNILYQLDKGINKDTIIYVKLHNFNTSKIKYSNFKKIKPFPKQYETYEFLNIADCLITDFSSVFFDFANTGKKIILYAHDKEEYIKERDIYLEYEKLPFTIISNIQELLMEVNDVNKYLKYNDFKIIYNKYDSRYSTENICKYVFKGKKSKDMRIIDGAKYDNNKENILFFIDPLKSKIILENYFNNKNIIFTFYSEKFPKNKEIKELNKNLYIPIQGGINYTHLEAVFIFINDKLKIKIPFNSKILEKIYKREIKRIYPNLKFNFIKNDSVNEKKVLDLLKYINF